MPSKKRMFLNGPTGFYYGPRPILEQLRAAYSAMRGQTLKALPKVDPALPAMEQIIQLFKVLRTVNAVWRGKSVHLHIARERANASTSRSAYKQMLSAVFPRPYAMKYKKAATLKKKMLSISDVELLQGFQNTPSPSEPSSIPQVTSPPIPWASLELSAKAIADGKKPGDLVKFWTPSGLELFRIQHI